MAPDDLAAALAALRERRPDAPFDVRWYASVPSTMDLASSLAQDGAAHGVVVVAEEQSAGRGRRGTTWASPPGAGLYLSFVARPGASKEAAASTSALAAVGATPSLGWPGNLSLLTLAAGVAVREGVQAATGLAPDLKWPNDLIVGRRKLAGILAEGLAIGGPGQAVIIGVGVNLQPAAYPPAVSARATSIEGELGRPVDRGVLLSELLIHLWDRLAGLDRSPGDILQAWRAASPSASGTRVDWEARHGVTVGIDEGGALLVRTSAGIERIIAGELQWML
jgi:BirA family transcriptional regulator, biotin operon repressor / biotin---[acetyl-CoA-carboxylase] ligase